MKTIPVLFIIQLIVYLATNLTNGYRILALVPFHGRSHFIMMEQLFKELAARGHEIDVLSHYPQKKKIPRYTDLSIAGSLPTPLGTYRFDKMGDKNFLRWFHMSLEEAGVRICKIAFNTTAAKTLRDSKTKYDLIITEIFLFDCMYGFAYHFNATVLAIVTNSDFPWGGIRVGNPVNPSYIPNHFLSYGGKLDLVERIWNTIYYLGTSMYYHLYAMDRGTQIAREFFGEDMPHLNQLIYDYTSFVLINTHISINNIYPRTPNFVEVAGLHIVPSTPLPTHIQKALNIGEKFKGVVYVSFGSLMAVETLPWNALDAFCKAFSELPYKILWKADIEKFPENLTLPTNAHFEKWMPQRDILCHPNVKLFVSHGGLMGTQEGVYCGVPVLGFPVFSDQHLNIESLRIRGIALKLDYAAITKEILLSTLKELLENPKYKQNAEKASILFRDRPQSALDTAVYWTEYVLKYRGAPHLKCVTSEMSWYEYFLIDVAIILTLISLSIIFIIYYILKFSYCWLKWKCSEKIKTQ